MNVALDAELRRMGRGQPVPRREDRKFLTGTGQYADDLDLPNQAWAWVVRSPHAHATVTSIATAEALQAPGVLAVLTAADLAADGLGAIPFAPLFKRPDGSPMAAPPRTLLHGDVVRYVGDPVALVIAETRAQAQDAADLVAVDYEPLEPVVDLRAAVAPGAAVVWPDAPDNIAAYGENGSEQAAVDAAFARAHKVVALELVNNRVVVNAIEPRAAIGEYDAGAGKFTIHLANHNQQGARAMLAQAVFKVPVEQVRLVVRDIGGGFGMKTGLYPEDALVLWAAKRLGRPVKWRADRGESFLSDTQARDHVSKAALALDRDGKILGLKIDTLANVGAYLTFIGAAVPIRAGSRVMTGVYHIPAARAATRAVLTNTVPTSAYRGAGRPESIYLIERLIELAARELGIDAVELRRRNMVRPEQMPYKTPVGETVDSGDFARRMDQALEAADWTGFAARKAASKARGRLRGRGLSAYIEWTGGPSTAEAVKLIVNGNGRVTLLSGTQAMGQGLETSYAQLVSDALGVPFDAVEVVQGDTDRIVGGGSVGSRSLFTGGSAAVAGSQAAIDKGKALAADALEAAQADIEYATGRFRVAGTDKGIGLFELAARQPQGHFIVDGTATAGGPSWPNGCHVIEVEIDPDTGKLTVDRYTSCDDAGRLVNPMIVHGQIHGGIVQGLGQAMHEYTHYDPDNGQLVTGSYMDYGLPRADDVPSFDVTTDESVPCGTNLLGSKGVGESGTVAATPALANAVIDALAEFGVRHIDIPLRPEAVWRAIRGGK